MIQHLREITAIQRVPSLATAGSIAVENGKPHTVARADSSLTIPVKGKS